MIKKTLFTSFLMTALCTINVVSFANVNVSINGEEIKSDVPATIINGRTLVPVRAISENMGAEVFWDSDTQSIDIIKNDKSINLIIGNINSTVNGISTELDVFPQIVNGTTLVPIRFIAENFDCNVIWSNENNTAYITNGHDKSVLEVHGDFLFNYELLNLDKPMILVNGRLYLSSLEISKIFSSDENSIDLIDKSNLLFPSINYSNTSYVSVNDISTQLDLWAVFSDTGVMLYSTYELWQMPEETLAHTDAKMACFRFEDIMAEPTEDSFFNHYGLEKFRYMGSWLYERGQSYSIAWIPLYINPILNIENDLLTNFNLYNADFIYTLDYLVANGGEIGIHGLTHQSGDEISAVGDEFGASTIFSLDEIKERMLRALDISNQLGYDAKFFEFPHYAITPEQLLIAESIYPAIYQQFPTTGEQSGKLEWIDRNGYKTLYIPTPADHVLNKHDRENALNRIKNVPSNQLVSLFFHPYIDWLYIGCSTDDDGKRIMTYSWDGVLPDIYSLITERGFSFETPF